MAYKGTHYQVASSIHMIEKIKDFLVACGWTLQGPSTNPGAQDDADSHLLGWFLHSDGEDGQKDINLHMQIGDGYNDRSPGGVWSYLKTTGGVDDSTQTFDVMTGRGSSFTVGDKFKIEDEIVEVGGISGDQLINCLRGQNGTTPASHAENVVLAKVTGTVPYIYVYPFADLDNPIAQSSSAGNLGTSASGVISGLDVYDAYTFYRIAMIKEKTNGKMRWIKSDPGDGTFTYDDFLTAPGTVDVDIISAGFFPPASRNQQLGVSYDKSDLKVSSLYACAGDEITDFWVYGSKDAFALVVLISSEYRSYYWGSYIPVGCPITTTAQGETGGDIASGDQTIKVGNVNLFTEGGKYRIIGQSYLDWVNNWDQSGSTYMGATGSGEWDNLDADEIAQEYVVVDSIDEVNATITATVPLNYNYKSGAVIGEDPRPCGSYIQNDRNGGNMEHLLSNDESAGAFAICFHTVGKAEAFSTHPAHRRRDKCGDSGDLPPAGSRSPWSCDGGQDRRNQHEPLNSTLLPYNSGLLDNEEHSTDRLPLIPYSVGHYYTDSERHNSFTRANGVIGLIRKMYSSLGAASEDTIRVLWNGQHETFRLFNDVIGSWIAVGPEIWP